MKDILLSLPRNVKILIIIAGDFLVGLWAWIIFGSPLATYLSSNFKISLYQIIFQQIQTFILPITAAVLTFLISGFYKSITRYKATGEGFLKASFGAFIFGLTYILLFIAQQENLPPNFLFIFITQAALIGSIFLSGIFFIREVAKLILGHSTKNIDALPLVIYGAGDIGGELLKALRLDNTKKVIAFFDDNMDLHGSTKFAIPIISKKKSLLKLKKIYPNLVIYLAIPSLDSPKRRKIIENLEELGLSVRSVPALHDLISGNNALVNMQMLSLEDLLPSGRLDNISFDYLADKSIFISGAGGSIGSELVRQIIINKPKELILYEQSEFNLYRVTEECKQLISELDLKVRIHSILGDVRNISQLNNTFKEISIDIIFHAAAYKHVPLVEMQSNIVPSIGNNILGTYYLCKIAAENKIQRFILISTDKAVRPTNIMGASKRMAELVCQGYAEKFQDTIFTMVRFGNVIDSSGSVIPLFRNQISNGGPVTITHKDITRFFMTIPEAASLVINAGSIATGGEVFLLDMGEQIRVYDLAEKMIRLSGRSVSRSKDDGGIEILEIGLRPGEKMFEELLISGHEQSSSNDKIFKSTEQYLSFKEIEFVIEDLIRAINDLDTPKLINILKLHVEGYNP